MFSITKSDAKFYFWKFVHNAVVHPLMAFPWDEPEWVMNAHAITEAKMMAHQGTVAFVELQNPDSEPAQQHVRVITVTPAEIAAKGCTFT